jgi:hypothetical protein
MNVEKGGGGPTPTHPCGVTLFSQSKPISENEYSTPPTHPSNQPNPTQVGKQTKAILSSITNEIGPKLWHITLEILPFSSSASLDCRGLPQKDHRHTSYSPARGPSPRADCCRLHTRSCSGVYSSIRGAFVHDRCWSAVSSGSAYISVV